MLIPPDSKSKAESERLICGSNQEGFRTGTIRPGNGIYGQKTDPVLGAVLRMGGTGTWLEPIIQYPSSPPPHPLPISN